MLSVSVTGDCALKNKIKSVLLLLVRTAFVKLPQRTYGDMGPKTANICKSQTKAALEQGTEEEKAPEKPEDSEEEKKPSDSDVIIAEKGEAGLVTETVTANILSALTENVQPCSALPCSVSNVHI